MFKKILSCFIILGLLLSPVSTGYAGAASKKTAVKREAIQFKDKNLETLIREMIRKKSGTIYKNDVSKITELYVYNKLTSLEGIQYLENLTKVYLDDNIDLNFIPLTKLKKLSTIRILSSLCRNVKEIDEVKATYMLPVEIPDPQLEAVVREQLRKESGDLTRYDMWRLSYLFINQKEIKSFDGLQYAKNLRDLEMFESRIEDYGALSCIPSLTDLSINRETITDLRGVASLRNLKHLSLLFNDLSDISALSSMKNLEYLGVTHNQIKDISPLQNLANLRSLSLRSNRITDISPLSNLTQLEDLVIKDNLFTDESVLKKFKSTRIQKGNTKEYLRSIELENRCRAILASITTPEMTLLEKEKAIHDYLVNNSRYDFDNYLNDNIPEESHTAYGLIMNGTGVCSAYAEATEILMKMAGISCITVSGKANGFRSWGDHAWNIVKIDGQYYHLDVTWDDPVSSSGTDILRYDYFNISDEVMSKDHTWDRARYPECPASLQ